MSIQLQTFRIVLVFCLLLSLFETSPLNRTSPEQVEISTDFESEEESDSSEVESRVRDDDAVMGEGEQGSFFQGDIELEPIQEEELYSNKTGGNLLLPSRIGLLGESYRWPKNGRGEAVVPYKISDTYSKEVQTT